MMRPGKAKGPSMGSGSGGGGTILVPTSVVNWMDPIQFTHEDFQDAAPSIDIQLYSLPARGAQHGLCLKTSEAFAGTGITSYQISIGIATDLELFMPLFEVTTAVGNTIFAPAFSDVILNMGAATSIRIQALADADLDNSTAGILDVWVWLAQLPAAN